MKLLKDFAEVDSKKETNKKIVKKVWTCQEQFNRLSLKEVNLFSLEKHKQNMVILEKDQQDLAGFLESLSPEHIIEVFTDGACSGNPGPGGWGAVLRSSSGEWEHLGGQLQTTNNRMEMLAAIETIKLLPSKSCIIIHTDSQYLKDGITLWLRNWKKNGWKTASKQPVKNQDLWQQLDHLSENYTVEWRWIKGHNGHPENERADTLARKAIIAQRVKL